MGGFGDSVFLEFDLSDPDQFLDPFSVVGDGSGLLDQVGFDEFGKTSVVDEFKDLVPDVGLVSTMEIEKYFQEI